MQDFISFIMGLLPYICLLTSIWLLRLKYELPLFKAVLYGALIWTSVIWLYTYFASFCQLLSPGTLMALWLPYTIMSVAGCIRLWVKWKLYKPAGWDLLILIILACTLITALAYPPNNYDVLTYHMPRIMHWLQNHSLNPYTTSIDRQIGMAPLNAILALQSVALANNDLCVNLGQWLAFFGCVIFTRHLARLLCNNQKAAPIAAIFTATLPAAIIQASNTDSCLIISFYVLGAMLVFMDWLPKSQVTFKSATAFGLCAGFAIMSKGSAYPLLLPLVLVIAVFSLLQLKKYFSKACLIAALVIAINLPHLYYNYLGTGNLIGSSEKNVNLDFSPSIICGNLIYNILINEPQLLAGSGLEFWLHLGNQLGLEENHDVLPWGGLKMVDPYLSPADGTSPNPLHLPFFLLIFFFLFTNKKSSASYYTWLLAAQSLLFCALLTWHPWMSRIQITLFFMASPLFAIFMLKIRQKWIITGILSLFALNSIWPLFLCVERPLAPASLVKLYRPGVRHFLTHPREELLFNINPAQMPDHKMAADILARQEPGVIMLAIGDNGMEYPIWRLLKKRLGYFPHIWDQPGLPPGPYYLWSKPRQGEEKAQSLKLVKITGNNQEFLLP